MSTQDGGLWLRCRISREPRPLPGAPQGLRLSGDLKSKDTAISLILNPLSHVSGTVPGTYSSPLALHGQVYHLPEVD